MCTAPQNIKFREGTTTKNNILCALHPKTFKFRENRTKKTRFHMHCTTNKQNQFKVNVNVRWEGG
jgi:hypothetical protein